MPPPFSARPHGTISEIRVCVTGYRGPTPETQQLVENPSRGRTIPTGSNVTRTAGLAQHREMVPWVRAGKQPLERRDGRGDRHREIARSMVRRHGASARHDPPKRLLKRRMRNMAERPAGLQSVLRKAHRPALVRPAGRRHGHARLAGNADGRSLTPKALRCIVQWLRRRRR